MLAEVTSPRSSASKVARFTECAMPRSSACTTSSRALAGYPSRSWVDRSCAADGLCGTTSTAVAAAAARAIRVCRSRMGPSCCPLRGDLARDFLVPHLLPQPVAGAGRRQQQAADERRFLAERREADLDRGARNALHDGAHTTYERRRIRKQRPAKHNHGRVDDGTDVGGGHPEECRGLLDGS